MGGRRDAGGIPPPILFLAPQKENGPWTVQEKKRIRGGAACLIPGKSLPAPWYRREFGGSRLPLLLVPLPLPGRSGAAQAESGAGGRGCPEDPNPRTTHAAGRDLPDFYRTLPPRSALFFWTVHGPFSFRQERKENGGCIPAGKAGIPRAEAARPLIGNQENVTTVPVFPSRASRHRSRLVMMARRPGLARTNFIAAWTLGSMLPTPNWPSAAYRAASARLR